MTRALYKSVNECELATESLGILPSALMIFANVSFFSLTMSFMADGFPSFRAESLI